MLFADAILSIFVLFVVTQLILPLVIPGLEVMWLFRKEKTNDQQPTSLPDLDTEVKSAVDLKNQATSKVDEVRKKTESILHQAEELKKKLD